MVTEKFCNDGVLGRGWWVTMREEDKANEGAGEGGMSMRGSWIPRPSYGLSLPTIVQFQRVGE